MKKQTKIAIKKVFSMENHNCPQLIIEMDNGIFWSCAKVSPAEGWTTVPCTFDEINHSIRFIEINGNPRNWEKLSGRTFEELESQLFHFVNKEVA